MSNVVATFTANIKPFQDAMNGLGTAVQQGTSKAQGAGQRIGGAMTSIGKASTVAGLAVAAMSASAIKSYGTFQESINKAAVIAGSSNKSLKGDMKSLEQEALSLGKTLPISAEEAGNAMVEMARNGASISDLKHEFPAIAKASAVAGADLAGTATTVQQAMNIWGGGAANAAKYSAILAKNANMSNAEVEDMGQAFANVGSQAKTLGVSVKDTSTAIGLMSNAGLGAAQGSQDLSHALTLMAKPTKVASSEMKKLGITYTDSSGQFKKLPQILKEVAAATDGMSQSQKIAALTNLFGAAGAKAMLPLLIQTEKKTKSGKSGWDAYSDSLGKVSGTAKAANKYLSENANNMTKNVGQSLAQMGDAFDAIVKSAIGTVAPQIQAVANALGDFATWLNKSNNPMASFTKKLIAWGPIIAAVLIVFGLLTTGLGKLVTAFTSPIKAIKQMKDGSKGLNKPLGQSASQIAATGVKALGAGVGIGVAAAGFALLAVAVAELAKQGTAGLIALAGMTAAIAALMVVAKLVAPTFQKNAIGLLAFGAAVFLVSSSMALLVTAFANFQNAGGNSVALMATIAISVGALAAVFALIGPALSAASVGMVAFGVAMLAITAGLAILVQSMANLQATGGSANLTIVVLVASIAALAAVFAVLGPLLTAGAVGIVAFGAAVLMIGAGVALATNGIANLINAIANLTGKSQQGKASTTDFANSSSSSITNLGTKGSSSMSTMASSISGSMSAMSTKGKTSGSSMATSLMGSFSKMATGASGSTSDIKGSFGSLGSFSLASAGSAIMGSFLDGLHEKWEGVKKFVGGIASWIADHKGPVSYDAKLLIPAGSAIMAGLNQGLQASFGNVQKTVSGMASDISASVASVAGSMSVGDMAFATPDVNQGDTVQSIDNSERVQPTFYVYNEFVGDKIRTSVKKGDKEQQINEEFFR